MKFLNALDIAPGWKASVLGGVAAAFLFANEVLEYLGREPLPASLTQAGGLLALWIVAMVLKARRGTPAP